MSGFGKQPFGVSPYGAGTPAIAPIPGGKALRDPFTGAQQSGRLIDAAKKQYVFDSFGRTSGMSEARQLVQLAVSTDRGSSAVRRLGNALYRVDRITDNFQRQVSDVFTEALSDIVNRKLISIQSIDTQQVQGSRIYVVIKWTDLTTQSEEVTTI